MNKQLPSYISRDFARRPPRGGEVLGALPYKPPSTTMAPLEQDRVGQKSRNPPNEPECGCWSFGKFKQKLGLGVVAQFLIAEMHFPAIFRKLWALLNLLVLWRLLIFIPFAHICWFSMFTNAYICYEYVFANIAFVRSRYLLIRATPGDGHKLEDEMSSPKTWSSNANLGRLRPANMCSCNDHVESRSIGHKS